MGNTLKMANFLQDNQQIHLQVVNICVAVLLGMILGVSVLFVPLKYLVFAIGGIFFVYLLLVKIEAAVILALFIQNQLARFNYLGEGTPFHPNGLMGLGIIAGALFFFATHKVDFRRFRAIELFSAFFLVCAISLINAGEYLMDGVTITLRLVSSLAIYAVLVYKLDSIKAVKWLLAAIIGAQVYPTVVGLLMYAGKSGLVFTDETMRLGNSGVGVYMAVVSILCLIFFINSKKTSRRLLWGGLTALFLAGLFFSFGRSGWIGFILALLFISVMRYKRLLFILPLVLILVMICIPAIGQRFSDISFDNLQGGNSSTLSQRINYWKAALEIHRDYPILGVGFGTGRYRVGDYRHTYPNMIHNDYISVLLETGLAGLTVFLLWHVQWLVKLVQIYRDARFDFDRTFALGVLTVFIASLVMRLTDNILLDTYDMYPLCALIAAAFALPRIRSGSEPENPEVLPSASAS